MRKGKVPHEDFSRDANGVGHPLAQYTFVRVDTNEGLVGYGEARAVNRTDSVNGYLEEAVPRYVLGHDPFNIEQLVQRMFREDYARAGETTMTGIALIEMACWDIVGKATAQPVYRLLGGAVREQIKAYANGWYTVERTLEEFHAATKRVIAGSYRALKFDPFGAGYYELSLAEKSLAISPGEAVRDAVGDDVEIRVEMRGRFNPATAIEMAHALAPSQPS